MKIIRYDVFTQQVNRGNPVGIITDGDNYSESEMQAIAAAVGYNECCFVCSSQIADYRLRYFTPGHETPLCGHATVGTMKYLVGELGLTGDRVFTVETGAGVLEIGYDHGTGEMSMEQANARFLPFEGDVEGLMESMGLTGEDLDPRWPICYGSTGSWTVLVPIVGLEAFGRMVPHNDRFPHILTRQPGASVHPFTLACVGEGRDMHGRHFSSPFSGTVEDPVTGTASGVMAAYWLEYIGGGDEARVSIEQGTEIGKDGLIRGYARREDGEIRVSISGNAVYSGEFELTL